MDGVRAYLEHLELEADTILASKVDALRADGVNVSYTRSTHVPPAGRRRD
jgi:hypothetical protein